MRKSVTSDGAVGVGSTDPGADLGILSRDDRPRSGDCPAESLAWGVFFCPCRNRRLNARQQAQARASRERRAGACLPCKIEMLDNSQPSLASRAEGGRATCPDRRSNSLL